MKTGGETKEVKESKVKIVQNKDTGETVVSGVPLMHYLVGILFGYLTEHTFRPSEQLAKDQVKQFVNIVEDYNHQLAEGFREAYIEYQKRIDPEFKKEYNKMMSASKKKHPTKRRQRDIKKKK